MKKAGGPSVEGIRNSLDQLADDLEGASLTSVRRKTIEVGLQETLHTIGKILDQLDPISQPVSIFDPSNPKIVGRFAALALVAQRRMPLAALPKSYGSGVYALYYAGDVPLYRPISRTETPIYVGQAAPTSNHATSPREQGPRLSSRLSTHARNIRKAVSTLSIEDFSYRALVVQSGWETAAEEYLIHLFKPIWNSETNILYGFGKHGDDPKTRANKRSPWDTIHPGREWAVESLEDAKNAARIDAEVAMHFAASTIYPSLEEILESFVEELRQV